MTDAQSAVAGAEPDPADLTGQASVLGDAVTSEQIGGDSVASDTVAGEQPEGAAAGSDDSAGVQMSPPLPPGLLQTSTEA